MFLIFRLKRNLASKRGYDGDQFPHRTASRISAPAFRATGETEKTVARSAQAEFRGCPVGQAHVRYH